MPEEPEVQDDIDFLAEDEVEDSEEEESEEEEEEDLEEESEEELEEESEEEEDSTRPAIQDLKKKFPDIFKSFPGLRAQLFREKEFSELFDSVDDAKSALSAAEGYNVIASDVTEGDGSKLISAIKETGQFNQFASNFLKHLESDKDYYFENVTMPVAESIVKAFYKEGARYTSKQDRENYQNAALLLSMYLFGSMDIARTDKTFKKAESRAEPKVDKERENFLKERYQAAESDVLGSIKDELQEVILETTKSGNLKIDPHGDMSNFLKSSITSSIMQQLGKALEKDSQHMRHMNSLWGKAKESGFTSSSKAKIVNAYLARARDLVPKIRQRVVSEALGKTPRKVESRKEPGSQGRVPSGRRSVDGKKVDWSKTSELDFLNDKVTLKG